MIYAHIRHVKTTTVVLDCLGCISVQIIWLTVCNQSGFPLSFFFAQEGTVIHNIERNGDFLRISGARWAAATGGHVGLW